MYVPFKYGRKDARMLARYLARSGRDGISEFRESYIRQLSDITNSVTLTEFTHGNFRRVPKRVKAVPMVPRIGHVYLRREGALLLARTVEEGEKLVRQATRIDMCSTEPCDVFLVEDGHTLRHMNSGVAINANQLPALFHGYRCVVTSDEAVAPSLRTLLARCATPLFTSTEQCAQLSKDEFEAEGYRQHAALCVEEARGSISAIIATNRPQQLAHVVHTLSNQACKADEILIGTHGFAADRDARTVAEHLGLPVTWCEMPADMTVGGIYGRLIEQAEGTCIAKMDDDDLYGTEYLATALWLTHASGAQLTGKYTRFVHFAEHDETAIRFPNRESVQCHLVAGPTLFFPRAVGIEVGYPDLARGDDTAFVKAVRGAGGRIVAGSRFGFAYVRHEGTHNWQIGAEMRDSSTFLHTGRPDKREFPCGIAHV